MINPQVTFNIIATHLLKQDKKSVMSLATDSMITSYQCAYRGIDGCKCAAGILIPDNQYTPEMEGEAIDSNWKHADKSLSRLVSQVLGEAGHDLHLVTHLQRIHDDVAVEHWHQHLATLADMEGLVMP